MRRHCPTKDNEPVNVIWFLALACSIFNMILYISLKYGVMTARKNFLCRTMVDKVFKMQLVNNSNEDVIKPLIETILSRAVPGDEGLSVGMVTVLNGLASLLF